MGTTTSHKNQIDAISNNHFLKKIFDSDIFGGARLIGINLHGGNIATFTLQTHEKPSTEVGKWGTFNQDFNTICIELTASHVEELTLSEWRADTPIIGLNIIDDGQLITITSTPPLHLN
ncbi:hypothetical protein [Chitinilyticum litopenaei]|uniref:hypothetical protein n=1 Tax=Chitinilyticum litopenaei TaxID=1121276 RepID=UPI0011860B4A|nr:hypothetical protein [Chitinilyticum litopenaei]